MNEQKLLVDRVEEKCQNCMQTKTQEGSALETSLRRRSTWGARWYACLAIIYT